jgi:hypothetical protein
MEEVDVAPALAAARDALEAWNQEHPQSWTPWEWLEEALLARRRWKRAGRKSPALAARNYQRYQEFAARIPKSLMERILDELS